MDHTTPGIPVGFTEIFISEMLQVVVNNQFSDWLKPTRLPLPAHKKINIFYLWWRLPRSAVLVEAAGFWVHEHRLRSASAPPAKPLAVCRFPHVSH